MLRWELDVLKGVWGEEKGEMGLNMIICLCIYDIMIFSRTKKKFKGKDYAQKHG